MPRKSTMHYKQNTHGRPIIPVKYHSVYHEQLNTFLQQHYDELLLYSKKMVSRHKRDPDFGKDALHRAIEDLYSGVLKAIDTTSPFAVPVFKRAIYYTYTRECSSRKKAFENGITIEYVKEETPGQLPTYTKEYVQNWVEMNEDLDGVQDIPHERCEEYALFHQALIKLEPKDRNILEWHLDGQSHPQLIESFCLTYGRKLTSAQMSTRLALAKNRLKHLVLLIQSQAA